MDGRLVYKRRMAGTLRYYGHLLTIYMNTLAHGTADLYEYNYSPWLSSFRGSFGFLT